MAELTQQPVLPVGSEEDFRRSMRLYLENLPDEPAPVPDRGFVGQVGAGVRQGVFGVGKLAGEAVSLVPGLRGAGSGIAEFFEDLQGESSGGIVEQGVAGAVQSLGTMATIAGGAALTVGSAPVAALAGGTAILFGLGEAAGTRDFLEDVNEQLIARGQTPLTAGEIRLAMVTNFGIEATFEGVANYLFARRLGMGPALKSAKAALRPFVASAKVLTKVGAATGKSLPRRVVEESALAATREAATESVQAAGQAGVLHAAINPERLGQQEAAGGLVPPTPGQAALGALAPAAVGGVVFAGAQGAVRRFQAQAQPAIQPAAEIQEQVRQATAEPSQPGRAQGEGFEILTPGERVLAGQAQGGEVAPQIPPAVQPVVQPAANVQEQVRLLTEGQAGAIRAAQARPPLDARAARMGGRGLPGVRADSEALKRVQAAREKAAQGLRPSGEQIIPPGATIGRTGGLPGIPRPQVQPATEIQEQVASTPAVEPVAPVESIAPPPVTLTPEQANEDIRLGERARVDPEPSVAQRESGIYQKGHLTWRGMDISIETPKGGVRRAVDGSWIVEDFPADYGYIKRTEGADGEQVDVYLGDVSESPVVWIVDQVDARTGDFDEHKAMLGFTSREDALAVYDRGFSDGLGTDRIGGVTEMSLEEFKQWLREGKTTEALTDLPGDERNPGNLPALRTDTAQLVQNIEPTIRRMREVGDVDDAAINDKIEKEITRHLPGGKAEAGRKVLQILQANQVGTLTGLVDKFAAPTEEDVPTGEGVVAQETQALADSGQRGTVELQKRIAALGGIKLPPVGKGTDPYAELRDLIHPRNDKGRRVPSAMRRNGRLTPERMAQALAEPGPDKFLDNADVTTLVRALDISRTQGKDLFAGDAGTIQGALEDRGTLGESTVTFPRETPGGDRADATGATRQSADQALQDAIVTAVGEEDTTLDTGRRGLLLRAASSAVTKTRQLGRDVLEIARTIPLPSVIEDLRTTGQAAFEGRTIRSVEDIAVAGQTLRDPRMERFYVIPVDAQGQVLTVEGVSARLASSSAAFQLTSTEHRRIRALERRIARAAEPSGLRGERHDLILATHEAAQARLGARLEVQGAAGYYLLHNHPSGHVVASPSDVQLTQGMESSIPGFRGHIILDSGVYSVIGAGGQVQQDLALPEAAATQSDPFRIPFNANVLTKEPIENTQDVARIGKMINEREATAVFMLTKAPGSTSERPQFATRGILLVPEEVWRSNGLPAYLRKRASEYGATQIVTFYQGADRSMSDRAASLMRDGVIADHVTRLPSGILGRDMIVSVQDKGVKPRRNRLFPVGVAVEESGQQFGTVTRAEPETMNGVTLAYMNKKVQQYAVGQGMTDAAKDANLFTDAIFRKHKISILDQDKINIAEAYKLLKNPDRYIKGLLAVLRKGRPVSTQEAAAVSWLHTAMLNAQHEKQVAGEITLEAYNEFTSNLLRSTAFGIPLQSVSQAARIMRFQQSDAQRMMNFNIPEFLDELQKKEGTKTPEELAEIQAQILQAIGEGGQALIDLQNRIKTPGMLDLFWQYYYGGLLSGFPTHAVNTVSTGMNIAFNEIAIKGTATAMDFLTAGVTGRQRTLYFREIPAGLNAAWQNVAAGRASPFAEAWYWWKAPLPIAIGGKGQPIPLRGVLRGRSASQRVRMDTGADSWAQATADSFPQALPLAAREQTARFMNWFSPFMGAAGRALAAEDVAMKTVAFDMSIAQQAKNLAIQQGLPEEQHQAFHENIKTHIEEFPDILAKAREVENDRTFNDAVSKLGNMLLAGRRLPQPLGFFFRLMFPFAGTPDRLITRGLELVPLVGIPVGLGEKGIALNEFGAKFKAGDTDALNIAAKQLVGIALAALTWMLWEDEVITGPIAKDAGERASQFRRGLIPHAIKINGEAYEYRRFEPLNIPIGTVTSIFAAMREIERKRERLGEDPSVDLTEDGMALAALAVVNMGRFVLDSSYFSGLAGFFQSLSQRGGGGITKGLSRQLASVVTPFVSLQRNLSRTLEASGLIEGTQPGEVIIRSQENLGESIQRGLPGLSTGVRPLFDAFGQPRTTTASATEAALSPVRRAELSRDPVERAMAAVNYFPTTPSKNGLQRQLGRRVTRDEIAAFQQRRGQIARQEVERLVGADFFRRLPPDRQKQRFRAAFTKATRQARKELFGTRGQQRRLAGVR